MCVNNEDRDIKIFDPKRQEQSDSADVQALAEEMLNQRKNGNSRRACKLGAMLSELTPYDNELTGIAEKYGKDPEVLYQIRVLATFTAESSLHMYVPNALLATTAINALYEKLMVNAPGFYSNISDGAAFTFYYLGLRRNRDVEQNIGTTFAMLCEMEHDEKMQALGTKIYTQFRDFVKEQVAKAEFVE